MRCHQVEKWIYLHRPGELSERERRRLEDHLVLCPKCRLLKESMQGLQNRVQHWRDVTSKVQMKASIKRPVYQQQRDFFPAFGSAGIPIRFACAVFVGVLFLFCVDRTVDAVRVSRMEIAATNLAEATLRNTGFASNTWPASSIPGKLTADIAAKESMKARLAEFFPGWTGSLKISTVWKLMMEKLSESGKTISWWNGLNEGEMDRLIGLEGEIIRLIRGQ